ncbi:MAG: diacylglycerol kinase family protein [Bacteroidales bacterium]|nr:diacylglycerol kinase family protein [Bacteroidales bacterium]
MPEKPEKPFCLKDRARSFAFAFRGIGFVVKTQHNIWIHCVLGILAIVFGLWLRINPAEWIAVIFAIGFVLVSETLNTAIELIVDLVSPEQNPKAGLIKDVAAGAVLLSAITAAIIGLLIFVPKIINLCF